jgi:hypothetical protein
MFLETGNISHTGDKEGMITYLFRVRVRRRGKHGDMNEPHEVNSHNILNDLAREQ